MPTVICEAFALSRSAADKVACNWAALTNEVGRASPFNITIDDEISPEPIIVIWREDAPAVAETGEIKLTIGAGLDCTWVEVVVVVVVLLPPPPPQLNDKSNRATNEIQRKQHKRQVTAILQNSWFPSKLCLEQQFASREHREGQPAGWPQTCFLMR